MLQGRQKTAKKALMILQMEAVCQKMPILFHVEHTAKNGRICAASDCNDIGGLLSDAEATKNFAQG